jgi:hypothetical protein
MSSVTTNVDVVDSGAGVVDVTAVDVADSVVDVTANAVAANAGAGVVDVASAVAGVTDSAANILSNNVSNWVDQMKEVSNNVVTTISEPNVLPPKKPVAFLIDIESKAIVESIVDLEDFSVSNLMKVLPKLITHVENYKNLKGPQKRSLVIRMVKHLIDITDGPGNDAMWDPILKQLVPGLIDTLLEVNDGKLKLRKKKLSFLKMFCCGPPKVNA